MGFWPENWFGWFCWFGSGLDTFAPRCWKREKKERVLELEGLEEEEVAIFRGGGEKDRGGKSKRKRKAA